MKLKLSGKTGFGLVEILITVAIGSIVFSGLVAGIYQIFILSSSSRLEAVALQDLSTVVERIHNTTPSNLPIDFPDGAPLPDTSGSVVQSILGGYSLEGESISISYPGGTETDPIEIAASVTWLERGRQRTLSIRTKKRG